MRISNAPVTFETLIAIVKSCMRYYKNLSKNQYNKVALIQEYSSDHFHGYLFEQFFHLYYVL